MSASLCLFVLCPGAYLRNYTSDLCVDPSLGPPVAGVGLVALQTCDTLCTSGLWMTSYLHMMGHVGPESGLPGAVVKVVRCSRGGGSASEVETYKNIDSVEHTKTTFQAHSIFSVSIQK